MNTPNLAALIKLHSWLLIENPYCYFEIAFTRQTQWMAWLCSKPSADDPNRIVIAKGQGSNPDEAAASALKDYQNKKAASKN